MLRLHLLALTLVSLFAITIPLLLIPPHSANPPHLNSLINTFALGNCDSLCWHGITLGKTTLTEAQAILSADPSLTLLGPDTQGCQIRWTMPVNSIDWQGVICTGIHAPLSDPVTWIYLSAPDRFMDTHFTLFDSFLIFGPPTGVDCTFFVPYHGPSTYSVGAVFKSGTQAVSIRPLPYSGLLFDALLPIAEVRYDVADMQRYYQPGSWRGFTSQHFNLKKWSGPCSKLVE